jgi:DNA-binding beta-propeller fold protein YncE
MADGNGSVFVNLNSTSQLARIDARTLTVAKLQSLNPCVGPSGMTMDRAHSRIFSVCENKLMAVSDSRKGELLATVPVGEGAKTVGFDSTGELVFSANGEGTLTVIKDEGGNKFSPLQTVKTAPGARTMAFDQERRQLYLVSARFGQRTGPTSEELQFRPTPVPGSAVVLVMKP